jgi:hypothetical protein
MVDEQVVEDAFVGTIHEDLALFQTRRNAP